MNRQQHLVMTVLARDGYRCVRCGKVANGQRGWDWSLQHRLPRSGGGRNEPQNLIVLCGSGTTQCHGHVESYRTEAYDNGWLVSRYSNPAAVAVLIENGSRYVYLGADGAYHDDPPAVVA